MHITTDLERVLDIVCVHPMGPSLQGVKAITESWDVLFTNDQDMRFTPHGKAWQSENPGCAHADMVNQALSNVAASRAQLVFALICHSPTLDRKKGRRN